MAKKLSTSFYLSDDAKELLRKLCEKENRSQGNMIEQLIKEAAKKSGIKPDKPPKQS